jgi:hypothetical protein
MRLPALFLAAIFGILPMSAGVAAAQPHASWRLYEDTASGFSFRYPPDLHVVPGTAASIEASHIEGLTASVSLKSDALVSGNPAWPVIRVHVMTCGPMAMCTPEAWLRSCSHRKVFSLGNLQAVQCVDFGSAACHWSATIRSATREVKIFSDVTDQLANDRGQTREECAERVVPADAPYPILKIFRTFRFAESNALAPAPKQLVQPGPDHR